MEINTGMLDDNIHSRMHILHNSIQKGELTSVKLCNHPVFSKLTDKSVKFLSEIQQQNHPITRSQEEGLIRILGVNDTNILKNTLFEGKKINFFNIFESLFEKQNSTHDTLDKVVNIININ